MHKQREISSVSNISTAVVSCFLVVLTTLLMRRPLIYDLFMLDAELLNINSTLANQSKIAEKRKHDGYLKIDFGRILKFGRFQ